MKKIFLSLIFSLGISITLNAQTNNRQTVVTDVETGISYRPSVLKAKGSGGIEFSVNPTDIISSHIPLTAGGEGFRIISGPSEKVTTTVVIAGTGSTVTTTVKHCDNTNNWPCAVVRGTKAE